MRKDLMKKREEDKKDRQDKYDSTIVALSKAVSAEVQVIVTAMRAEFGYLHPKEQKLIPELPTTDLNTMQKFIESGLPAKDGVQHPS